MARLAQDLQLALRRIARSPAFAGFVIVLLALTLGITTALWSVVDAVLLSPLPYPEGDRLMMLLRSERGREYAAHSPADFLDLRERTSSFDSLAAVGRHSATLTDGDSPERLTGASISGNFFPTLGISAHRGRTFDSEPTSYEDEALDLVISYGLWQRRFGGRNDVLGETLRLDDVSYRVVGITPPSFDFPEGTDYWTRAEHDIPPLPGGRPLPPDPSMLRGMVYFSVLGRLAEGISPEAADSELQNLITRLDTEHPGFYEQTRLRTVSLRDHLVGDAGQGLILLLGGVGLLLLIACANITNLLLARGAARRREVALRGALGAPRGQLLRQELMESLVLAGAGGALGLVLAQLALDGFQAFAPNHLPRLGEVGLDPRVMLFSAALVLGTGLLFGLLPALNASRILPRDVLGTAGHSGESRAQRRWRSGLVMAEIALALVLLIGSGLLFKSLHQLGSVDPGFQREGLLTASLRLADGRYPGDAEQSAFFDRTLERLEALPGVRGASVALALPMSGIEISHSFNVEGRPPAENPEDEPVANLNSVSAGYFEQLGIPLLAGRGFTKTDREGAEPVAVISQGLADRYFPSEEAIGQRLGLPSPEGELVWRTVVGVAADVRQSDLENEPQPTLYTPFPQNPWPFGSLVLATDSDPLDLATPLRRAVAEIDPAQAVSSLYTMEQRLARTLEEKRFLFLLLTTFALFALVLAAMGVYGVMTYDVTRRTQEIGIRMALGARSEEILQLILGNTLRLLALGLPAGLLGAFALTRFLTAHLYQVSPADPTTFITLAGFLSLCALLASYLPARRATAVVPNGTLRQG